MLEMLGFSASALLILSSVPQLIHTFKTKDTRGLSLQTLFLWFFGVMFMGIYVLFTSAQLALLLNYAFNTVIVGANIVAYFAYNGVTQQDRNQEEARRRILERMSK